MITKVSVLRCPRSPCHVAEMPGAHHPGPRRSRPQTIGPGGRDKHTAAPAGSGLVAGTVSAQAGKAAEARLYDCSAALIPRISPIDRTVTAWSLSPVTVLARQVRISRMETRP